MIEKVPSFRCFLGVGVLLQLALFITTFYLPVQSAALSATWLLAPSFLGILVLLLLNGGRRWQCESRTLIAILLGLGMLILFVLNQDLNWHGRSGSVGRILNRMGAGTAV
jgi:uncharacterized membrane protein